MELFREDGHLTAEGLQAITDGTLDELQSLEAAEHLSFCDKCLAQYTLLLQEDTLMQPSSSVKDPVVHRLKTRSRRILFSKYGTIAAAACLAVTVWFTGNHALSNRPVTTPDAQPAAQTERVPLNERLNQAAQNFSDATDQFFGNLFGGEEDPTPPPTVSQAQQRDEANRQREAVFDDKDAKQDQKSTNARSTPPDASSQADK